MAKEYSPYPFRMPAETREALDAKAKSAGRSLQQEMLRRIELTLTMEGLFKTKVQSIDGLYDFVFEILGNNQKLEKVTSQLSDEVARLQEQNRILTQSTRVSDEQRFDSIRRAIASMKDAVDKAEKALPIIPGSAGETSAPYNPNR